MAAIPFGIPELEGWTQAEQIGAGGMGAVFRIVGPNGVSRAVKLVPLTDRGDGDAEGRVLREIETCRMLDHPNIVQTISTGRLEAHLFVLMELCGGGSLQERVEANILEEDEAVAFGLQLLDGLEYAHASGIVHRDVKPRNVLLGDDGEGVKLADFGLAKAFESAGLSGLTPSGMAGGTPEFMPRTQLLNYRYVGPEVDVWACAATIYFMLTGTSPRTFEAGRDRWRTVVDTMPVPIRERRPSLTSPLAKLIDDALDDAADLPYADAAALRTALTKAR